LMTFMNVAVSCILNAGKGGKVHTQNYACLDGIIDHVPKRRHSISFNHRFRE